MRQALILYFIPHITDGGSEVDPTGQLGHTATGSGRNGPRRGTYCSAVVRAIIRHRRDASAELSTALSVGVRFDGCPAVRLSVPPNDSPEGSADAASVCLGPAVRLFYARFNARCRFVVSFLQATTVCWR